MGFIIERVLYTSSITALSHELHTKFYLRLLRILLDTTNRYNETRLSVITKLIIAQCSLMNFIIALCFIMLRYVLRYSSNEFHNILYS